MDAVHHRGSVAQNLLVAMLVGVVLLVAWTLYSQANAPPALADLLASAQVPAEPVPYPGEGVVRLTATWDGTDLHRTGSTEQYTLTLRRMGRGGEVRSRPGVPIRVRMHVEASGTGGADATETLGRIEATVPPPPDGSIIGGARRAWAGGMTDANGRFAIEIKLQVPAMTGPQPKTLDLTVDEFRASSGGRSLELVASTVHSVEIARP